MRQARRAATALALAGLTVLAAACDWSQSGFDANRSSYNPLERTITTANVANLTEAFRVAIPSSSTSPVVDRHGVVVSGRGILSSYDRATGAPRWSTTVDPGEPSNFAPVSGDTFLRNGEVVATAHRGQWVTGGWQVQPGGTLMRVDAATGATITSEQPAPVLQAVRGSRWAGANLTAHAPAGGIRLQVKDFDDPDFHWGGVAEPASFPISNHESLTLGVDRLYQRFQSASGAGPDVLAAYDLTTPCPVDAATGEATCTPIWEHALELVNNSEIVVSEDGGTLFVASSDWASAVVAFDAATGAERWRTSPFLGDSHIKPAVAEGRLYVTNASTVRVFDVDGCGAATCSGLWSAPGGQTGVVVAGDVAYVGYGSSVRAFAATGCGAASCRAIWSASTGAPGSLTALAVGRGRVYGTTDRELIAWALPT